MLPNLERRAAGLRAGDGVTEEILLKCQLKHELAGGENSIVTEGKNSLLLVRS